MFFEQGDIVEFDFSPSIGHEPKNIHPALVVSNGDFNTSTSMTIVCPITSNDNGFYLHEPIPAGHSVFGFVVMEQPRALDLDARGAVKLDHLSRKEMAPITICLKSFF